MGLLISVSNGRSHRRQREALPGFLSVHGSVGQGAANGGRDVIVVQTALNAVVSSLGGPSPILAVDGLIGPKTIAAIRKIQSFWTAVQDGRVDPGGPTIRVLNRLAGLAPPIQSRPRSSISGGVSGGSNVPQTAPRQTTRGGASSVAGAPSGATAPPPAPTSSPTPEEIQAVNRLQNAQTVVMPVVVVAIVTALDALAKAQQYLGVIFGGGPPPAAILRSPSRLAFLFVAKHFRLHESDPQGSLFAVQQVKAVFARMIEVVRIRTLTTPAGPRFDRLYALAIVPAQIVSLNTDIAYVGTLSGALTPGVPDGYTVPDPATQRLMPEFCDGVYLMPGFDRFPTRPHAILIHELAHLCGGFDEASKIRDFTVTNENAFDADSRAQHLINVNIYERFAIELLLSTALSQSTIYGPANWSDRLPASTGGGNLTAPADNPLAFPFGFL